jgi:hypothetical protein
MLIYLNKFVEAIFNVCCGLGNSKKSVSLFYTFWNDACLNTFRLNTLEPEQVKQRNDKDDAIRNSTVAVGGERLLVHPLALYGDS